RNAKAKFFRIAAVVILIGAITVLALKPSISVTVSSNPIILLTPGFDPEIADSLRTIYPNAIIQRTNSAPPYGETPRATSLTQFVENDGAVNFVIGEGLSTAQLDLYPNIHYKYFPSKKPLGITSLILGNVTVNHINLLSGKINHNQGTVLTLNGPGGIEDSIKLRRSGEGSFSFSFTPRQPGTFVYRLTIRDSLGTILSNNLPLEILPEKKLNILAVLRHPTFEFRQLKSFLTEKGHGVVMRYQVSKNRYRYEYVNHDNVKVDQLSAELMDEFDLVCITAGDFETLSDPEITNLRKAVRSGLGVLILFDQLQEKDAIESFLLSGITKINRDTLRVEFKTAESQSLSVFPAELKSTARFEPLLQSANQQFLTGFRFEGLGKIGVQLLNETFILQLRGQQSAYSEIWTPLLEQTAREEVRHYKINITSPAPLYPDDPIDFDIISSAEAPDVSLDGIHIPLIEDITVDDFWHGKIWTSTPGWHSIEVRQDSTVKKFYVHNPTAWNTLALNNQIQQNQVRAWENALPLSKSITALKPISVWIMVALLLIAFSYLWLEPRI
ncbi:MAG TPA: hypothetical protein PLR06_08530, partial [Cyclobacteriaceae bacterium]|nr:hypothetical protein [Cyclobacteriaceae bacterium]